MDNNHKNNGGSWFYYHTVNKIHLGPLTLESIATMVASSAIELENIVLAQPGWSKWKKALDIPEFLDLHRSLIEAKNSALPPIEDIEGEGIPEIPHDVFLTSKEQNVETNWQDEHIIDRRKHPRFELELKVLFIVDRKSFRTKTIDLSLGGLKIASPLPEYFLNRPIQVFLSSADLKFLIKFEAELILAKSKSLNQIKFVNSTEDTTRYLDSWLQSMCKNKSVKTA